MLKFSRGGAEPVQRCRGAEVQKCRSAEVLRRCSGSGTLVQVQVFEQVQERCRCAEDQRWCRCAGFSRGADKKIS